MPLPSVPQPYDPLCNLDFDTSTMGTMANLPPFEYSALSTHQIRILAPDPADTSGLSWVLRTASIDDPDLYFTALSYTWACHTHPDTFPISCNGRQLYVHHNLFTALPYIARRYASKEALATPYWIDAICINQTDEEEKASQIRLMNTIYRHADKVLAWLGLTFNLKSQAFIMQAIELLPLLIKELARSRQPGPGGKLTPNFEVDRQLGDLGREGWEAIIHLIRNSYFRRVWMVQEIALAKEITFLCGDHEIESHLMEEAIFDSWHITRWTLIDPTNGLPMRFAAEYHDDSVVFFVRNMINYDGHEGNAHKTIRIANLLDEQACSAPQDRVLGILGMVEEEFGNASKDLHTYTSIADLYTRFSTMLFEASGLTDVHWWYYMSMAFRKNRIKSLPSWVPDLHHNRTEDKRHVFDSMMAMRSSSDPPWQASSRPRKAAHGPRPGEIVLRGKLVDHITHVYPEVPCGFPDRTEHPGTAGTKWLSAVTALIQWERSLSAAVLQPGPSATKETPARQVPPADTYWRTLLADLTADAGTGTQLTYSTWRQFQEAGPRFLALVPRLERLRSETDTDPWDVPDWTDSEEERETMQYFRDVTHPVAMFMAKLSFTRDRQMISTRDGRLGFTCTGVQPADAVCVFNNSVSPFVVRKVDVVDGTTRWKLVGDAYVSGLMYREADGLEVEEADVLLV